MEFPIFNPPADERTAFRCRNARVYVDSVRRRDLKALSWEMVTGPPFGKAIVALDPSGISSHPGIGDLYLLPPIGSAVLIRPDEEAGGSDLPGIVTAHLIDLAEAVEQLVAQVEHRLASALGTVISRRWQLDADGLPREVVNARVRFNAGANMLASASTVPVNGREAHVFDSSRQGQPWTVADALGYLIATAVPEEVEAPAQAELEELAGSIELGAAEITGMTVAHALKDLAHRGGIALRAAADGQGLIFYRPGRQGRHRTISLQPAGSGLSLTQSNLWRGQIELGRRPCRRRVVALGEPKYYESTFELSKGWDAALQPSRWRDFVRGQAVDWAAVSDVYRKWVLNEHGRYCVLPWLLPLHDFSSISAEDFLLPVARRFLPCLSADVQGQSLGYVVEFSLDDGTTWQRWAGPLWVSSTDCSIYLGGDGLPGEYFGAAAEDLVRVRITATVAADSRLSVEIPGDAGAAAEVIRLSGRAAWRKVHSGSIFYQKEGLGAPAEMDDTLLLCQMAQRHAETISSAAEGKLKLGWTDTTFNVGDIIERVEGRPLELASNPDARLHVVSVKHDFGTHQSTTLFVSG